MVPLDDFSGLPNWPRLQAWIDQQDLPGAGPITGVLKLAGGTQNNVFLLQRGREQFVLRRPPLHLRAKSDETMLREVRVLRALDGSEVPHPRLYAGCEDLSVLGACFYVMAALEGFSPWQELPGRYAEEASWRRQMGEALVGAAAALGALDHVRLGLSDLGRPVNWHERQVDRWRSQLEGYGEYLNYKGEALPHVDEIGRWLSDNVPAERRIGVIHGDLNICNVMFSHRSPAITGIVDWELTTLGDPLLDLGWILASWCERDDPPGQEPLVRPWDGFPSRNELVQRYGELAGREMSVMPWFFTLACFKLGCILEGNYARAGAGLTPPEIGARHHARAMWLMRKARQIIAQA